MTTAGIFARVLGTAAAAAAYAVLEQLKPEMMVGVPSHQHVPRDDVVRYIWDILMGRGKRVSEWPGNVFFRQTVNKHRERYNDAER